jgi:hypothetical protein
MGLKHFFVMGKETEMIMSNVKWMMAVSVIGLLAGSAGANEILSDGFESGLSAWYIEGTSGASTTNSPVYAGTQALKLTMFNGDVATLQRRFSNETARKIELTMWVYIPAGNTNERSLEIELRDPAQTDETPGPYVLFKEGEGLGVFTNYTGWSADFTKITDVVADQWTKLVIRTDVGSKKMTVEYNGVVYDNGGLGYGWATTTLNSLGKIKITGPSTTNDVTCYIDDMTVTEIVQPNVGTLFSDDFESGVSKWGYAETWNGILSDGDIVHGGGMSLKLTNLNSIAPVMASAFSNPNALKAVVSIWVYIPSASASERTLEITLRDSAQDPEENGPYVLFKEGEGLGVFSNFGWWGATFTKVADVVADRWVKLVISADIVTKTMTIQYDGKLYDNSGLGYAWGSNTLSNLNKIVIWGPSTLGAMSFIDDLEIADSEVQRILGDANSDGAVDVKDLSQLAANYGMTSGATWAMGDFTGDGAVGVSDLSMLAANYGAGSTSTISWADAYAQAFGTSADDSTQASDESTSSTVCSSLGLSLVAGLALMGLMLVKLEE